MSSIRILMEATCFLLGESTYLSGESYSERPSPLVIAEPGVSLLGVLAGFLEFSILIETVLIGSQVMATYLLLFLSFLT